MNWPEAEQSRTRWILIPAIWLAFGLVNATQVMVGMRAEGMQHPWHRVLLQYTLAWTVWALATPFVFWLGRRVPVTRTTPISGWLVHLAACFGISTVHCAWYAGLQLLLRPWGPKYTYSFPLIFRGVFLSTFHLQLIAYATILAICHVIDSRRKLRIREMEAAQLSAQLAKAQLDALRHQLEPHFLFNTLNTIAGLVREGRDSDAVTMIAGLSDLLRLVLDDSNRQEISFGEELEFLENYLEIQKMRFADRLQIMMDVPRELYPAQVPSLMLQPIVENAIQHGICKRVNGGAIRIVARNQQGMLTVSVHNDGPGMNGGSETKGGIGLSNVRNRLQSLYGGSGALHISDHLLGGVEVVLSVPYRQGAR
jgi:hypothetical protein